MLFVEPCIYAFEVIKRDWLANLKRPLNKAFISQLECYTQLKVHFGSMTTADHFIVDSQTSNLVLNYGQCTKYYNLANVK